MASESESESYLVPFNSLVCMLLGISFTVWVTLLLVFIIVPAILGVSFGIRRIYMKTLLKIFDWATRRMERRAREKNQELYKPYSNGIIAKEPVSLEQEIQELRSSNSCGGLSTSGGGGSSGGISPGSSSGGTAATSGEEGPAASATTTTTTTTAAPAPSSTTSLSSSSSAEFEMADIFSFCRRGVESIVDDEVTKRFTAEELESWNLLTRSNYNFQHISTRLTVLWGLGLVIRYGFLLPLRVTLAFTGVGLLVVLTTAIGLLPNSSTKNYLSEKVHLMCYRICVRALTAIITYHDSENKPRNGGICVANHTSPIDVIILASDGCYAMVGQVHGGLIGIIQRSMVKACPHIWFERSEVKDRHLVAKRLNDHVADKSKLPILIFPEGTCINNTSVMMFKKGSFEVNCVVYPVAIKYDPRFGDAFWNSSKFGMVTYLLHMMSSWAIVCSVWYLPPMRREEGEDAAHFANRVKAAIARKGGLVDLLWDGGLKRQKVKGVFKEEQQKLYSKVLVGMQEERDSHCCPHHHQEGGALEQEEQQQQLQPCLCGAQTDPEEEEEEEEEDQASSSDQSPGTEDLPALPCNHGGSGEDHHNHDDLDHHCDSAETIEADRKTSDHIDSTTQGNQPVQHDQSGRVDDDDGGDGDEDEHNGQSCEQSVTMGDGRHSDSQAGPSQSEGKTCDHTSSDEVVRDDKTDNSINDDDGLTCPLTDAENDGSCSQSNAETGVDENTGCS